MVSLLIESVETVGGLIKEFKRIEEAAEKLSVTDLPTPTIEGKGGFIIIDLEGEQEKQKDKWFDSLRQQNSIRRFYILCQAERRDFTLDTVEQLRAELCMSANMSEEEVDALQLETFVSRLRPNSKGQIDADNRVSRGEYDRLLSIKRQIDPDDKYVGTSVPILRVFERIQQLNRRPDKPVLIVGPTGAGKTELAQLIHDSSSRSENSFLSEQAADNAGGDFNIVKSRWVGYGAQSGINGIDPKRVQTGLLQECKGGTIFVDEVAKLTHEFQTFLLTILDRKPIPLTAGKGDRIKPDVRLVFAANEDLESLADAGRFKPDLLDRIKRFTITIPALDDRKEDILDFVNAKRGQHKASLDFVLALLRHSWSNGNVRELIDVIEMAIAKTESKRSPLTAGLLVGLVAAQEVADMEKDQVDGELYQLLYDMLTRQGWELNRGLQHRMSKLLRVSDSTVTGMAKLAQCLNNELNC